LDVPESSCKRASARVPLTPSRLDKELVFPSSPTRIDEDSSANNNELLCSNLAWGNLRRRQGIGKAEAATDPVLRFAISQLMGAVVTGWYGNGFNAWPEEDRQGLSDLIFKIWLQMAIDQHQRVGSQAAKISLKPTFFEGRKVITRTQIPYQMLNYYRCTIHYPNTELSWWLRFETSYRRTTGSQVMTTYDR
jgi:hypothetical protein